MRNVKTSSALSASCVLATLVFIFAFSPLLSQDSLPQRKQAVIRLGGYIKDLHYVSFTDQPGSLIAGNLIHNRINVRWNVTPQFHVRAEVRNRLYYGEVVRKTYGFGKFIDAPQGIIDLSHNIVDDSSVVLNTTIDRLLLNWSNNHWDITAGRQRINWGMNIVWNPNDIFNAFNYFDFDYEERPGTDAFRAQYYFAGFTSLEIAAKISDKKDEQVAAIMYRTNWRKYDLQNFAGICFDDLVVGIGWAGNIRNFGFKGESTYFHPRRNFSDTTGELSASLSLDRSFKNNYFAMISYLYTSAAENSVMDLQQFTGSGLTAKRLMPFRHSLFAQVSKSFNPLLNASLAVIFSPSNNSLILLPSLALSIATDWDIALIGQSFFSDQNNNYRSAGSAVYVRLRWSF